MQVRAYHRMIFICALSIVPASQVWSQSDLTVGSSCSDWESAIVLDRIPGQFTMDGVPLFPAGDYYINSVIRNIGDSAAVFQDGQSVWKILLDGAVVQDWTTWMPEVAAQELYNPMTILWTDLTVSRGGRYHDEWLAVNSPYLEKLQINQSAYQSQELRTSSSHPQTSTVRLMAPAQVLFEGFEGAYPGNWILNDYSTGNYFNRSSTEHYEGAFSAVQYYSEIHYLSSGLMSPPIDLSAYSGYSAALSFWEFEAYAEWHVYHVIRIYVNGILQESVVLNPGTETWSQVTVDLSLYIGQRDVQVEFYYEGQDADDWYIDAVEVATSNSAGFMIAPNICMAGYGINPVTLSEGEHLLELVIDSDGLVTEQSEINNYYSRTITVSNELPDIEISPTAVTTNVAAGSVASIDTITVANMGTSNLSFSITLEDLILPEVVTFAKEDWADWTAPENQDRITDNVWITRAHQQSLFNAYSQIANSHPHIVNGTEWALGYTADVTGGYATDLVYLLNHNVGEYILTQPLSLHLIEDNLYYDVIFDSWTMGANGGGFSYTRTRVYVDWLDVNPVSGTVLPDSSIDLIVTFDASWLNEGDYPANIHISSNDLDEPLTSIPVTLTVHGSPDISLGTDSLRFGNVIVASSNTMELAVSNNGTAQLVVGPVQSSSGDFSVNMTSFELAPRERVLLDVIFTPTTAGYQTGLLTFTSNDTSHPQITATLFGNGLPPSEIVVTPDSISVSVDAGGTDTSQTITIENTGTNLLIWSLSVEEPVDAAFPSAGTRAQRIHGDQMLTGEYLSVGNYKTITFTKDNYADWTLAENQDRITDNVWITRANTRGIFNIAQESEYNRSGAWESPADTKWSFGFTKDLVPENYQFWGDAIDYNPPRMVGRPMSVHLASDDIYIDLIFNSWTSGEYEGGGGFSYTRTTVGADWFSVTPKSGVVAPGETVVLKTTFDAKGEAGGDYYAYVLIQSNDLDESLSVIPLHMFVEGSAAAPIITEIIDVPDDQGGRVYVNFIRSYYDVVDAEPMAAAAPVGNAESPAIQQTTTGLYTVEFFDGVEWRSPGATTTAYGAPNYSVMVHTLVDSTSVEEDGMLQFRVVASIGDSVWISDPALGYSLDNLAPVAPTGLVAIYDGASISLAWDAPADEDFNYFNIYRGEGVEFVPTDELRLATTTESRYTDEQFEGNRTYYYLVSAVDAHGNESAYSDISSVILTVDEQMGIPESYALHPNYPNPFNPVSTIRYDLPKGNQVSLIVYDIIGREMVRLVDDYVEPGYHQVQWNGRDQDGQSVPSGIYIARLVTPGYTKSIKMVLLK